MILIKLQRIVRYLIIIFNAFFVGLGFKAFSIRVKGV